MYNMEFNSSYYIFNKKKLFLYQLALETNFEYKIIKKNDEFNCNPYITIKLNSLLALINPVN